MNYHVIKPIVGGLILGSIFFFFPFFVVKVIGFLLILGMIFWIVKGRRSHWRRFAFVHPDKIRSMSDEEYESYKANFGRTRCYPHYGDKQDTTDNTSNQDKK